MATAVTTSSLLSQFALDLAEALTQKSGRRKLLLGQGFLPAISIVIAMASASLLNRYEESIGSTANVSAESASVIMSTVAVHGILTAEVALLASSSKRTFHDLADQNLAAAGDRQGIGGSYEDDSNVTPISRA